jgi:hypothetical protein
MRCFSVALIVIFLVPGCSGSMPDSSGPPQSPARQLTPAAVARPNELRERNVIEDVLINDVSLSQWAGHFIRTGWSPTQSVSWLATQMRGIDTSLCPVDFREAYYRHYHAWANMSTQLASEPQSFGEGVLTGLINSLSGEMDGGYKTMKQDRDTRSQQIGSTWAEVELCAIRHGAKLSQMHAPIRGLGRRPYLPLAPNQCIFSAEDGSVSGVSPDLSNDVIAKLLPFHTAIDPGGTIANYGGGVFFRNHDFYFYTAARALNVRAGCKISTADDLLHKSLEYFVIKFGKPIRRQQYPLDYPFGQFNQSWPGYVFMTSYGTLYVEFDQSELHITNIYAVHYP